MLTYILGRCLSAIPVLLGVSVIVFAISRATPGDPVYVILGENAAPDVVEKAREKLGLNQPLHVQYFTWLASASHGDFGVSMINERPILPDMIGRLPATLQLVAVSVTISLLIGLPFGVLSAARPNSLVDAVSRLLGLAGLSFPGFWWALVLIIVFAYQLQLVPISGYGTPAHLVLPALALGMRQAGVLMRLTRSSLLNVIREDYVRTAQSKGLRERVVLLRHALPNALLPVTTAVGIEIGDAIAGAVVIETIFGWPGIGRFTFDAMIRRDFPTIMAAVVFFAWIFVLVNLVVDLAYSRLDPRIRLS